MTPYPRMSFFDVDSASFSAMIERTISKGKSKMEMDYENMEQESKLFPYVDHDNIETDPDILDEAWGYEDNDDWDDDYEYDDDMDGDWDSGMTSAGWGTDEDYGYYGEDY
jgi:hypothetical protein